jgi:CheY-like chemotaxis protein
MEKKILVVDDEPGIVDIVETLLTANGYTVYTAYSGEEGLKKCKSLKPDAVLLDIMMPDRDGASIAEEIKEDPKLCNIPIIFLTGAVRSSEVPKSHIVGGQYFLAKPFKEEQLLKIVRQVLLGY